MKRLLFCLFLLSLAGLVRAAPPLPQEPVEADRVVAVVNDEVITLHELQSRLDSVVSQLKRQGTELPPQEVLQKQMLERMIMDRIQVQYAKENGLHVEDGELDMAINRIAANNKMTPDQFRKALEKDGVAFVKFREEIRDEMLISRLKNREVDSKINISEGEVDNYLAGQAQAGVTPEYHLAHILVRTPEGASPEQLQKLKAKAEQIMEHLRKGDDFAQVAAAYSDAPDALEGGDLGVRPADRLPNLYAEAAAKLQPGEVSPLLHSPNGFHIVRLLEKRGGGAALPPVQQTHARHILIKVNELVSEDEARRKLQAVRERLEHGGDFAELARLYSQDGTASKGGDLGWVYPGDTVPEFERAMDQLKVGEISQPVQTQFGFHLIQVLERRTQDVSDERRRVLARQVLRDRRADEDYQDWLRQMRDRAYVENKLNEE
ncbi:peptidylprolyl isomerase [Azospira inquinata]|uniref:Chaperone SurA n=1 Tax=Azospira inquinata TaxID=2785627 RepID=A0A975SLV7_9RHOO|nr:peptidylprolyl isomerase [Azospira inquinata]QWT46437.1 peptidylprolyl isomerase [Azospira inquinata]QWT48239.1 peptidylprolyl isomerase [Azospira inquinata]